MLTSLSNSIVLSKIINAATQFFFILLIQFYLPEESANIIFRLLSFSAIMVAISSFGANAALGKYLSDREEDKVSFVTYFLFIIKAVAITIISVLGYTLNLFDDINLSALIFITICLSLGYLDYVAESKGNALLKYFSRIKIVVITLAFLVKLILLFLYTNALEYFLYIEWFLIFIICILVTNSPFKGNPLRSFSKKEVVDLLAFLRKSSWVWLSSILQMAWSRGSFLILANQIGAASSNIYFVFIRIIEACAFIPNAMSMNFFSKALKTKGQKLLTLKEQYLKEMVAISVGLSFIVFIGLFTYVEFFMDISASFFVYPLAFLSTFFFMMRVSLSREIVLTGKLYWSLVSYLSSFSLAWLVFFLIAPESFEGALVSYLIYVLGAYFVPLVLGKKTFMEYITLLRLW